MVPLGTLLSYSLKKLVQFEETYDSLRNPPLLSLKKLVQFLKEP